MVEKARTMVRRRNKLEIPAAVEVRRVLRRAGVADEPAGLRLAPSCTNTRRRNGSAASLERRSSSVASSMTR
jgi:hypothetical protein